MCNQNSEHIKRPALVRIYSLEFIHFIEILQDIVLFAVACVVHVLLAIYNHALNYQRMEG